MHFRRIPGSKNSQKWEFAPERQLKSTAIGAKMPWFTPMDETLLPCTLGLVTAGVAFGLDLRHTPQKHKNTSNFGSISFCRFLGRKTHCCRFFSSLGVRRCGCALWPHTNTCEPAVLSSIKILGALNPQLTGVKKFRFPRNPKHVTTEFTGHAFFFGAHDGFTYFFRVALVSSYVNPKYSARGDDKMPCNRPTKKKTWAAHPLLADFAVHGFQWVQRGRCCLHIRMQQVCRGHGCFRIGQQSSGG